MTESKKLCTNLGGEMTMSPDFQYSVGDSSFCSNRFGSHWIPVVLDKYVEDNDQYFWLDDRPSQNKSLAVNPKWPISQPNSMGLDECVLLHGEGDKYFWNDQNCKNTVATCTTKFNQQWECNKSVSRPKPRDLYTRFLLDFGDFLKKYM